MAVLRVVLTVALMVVLPWLVLAQQPQKSCEQQLIEALNRQGRTQALCVQDRDALVQWCHDQQVQLQEQIVQLQVERDALKKQVDEGKKE